MEYAPAEKILNETQQKLVWYIVLIKVLIINEYLEECARDLEHERELYSDESYYDEE